MQKAWPLFFRQASQANGLPTEAFVIYDECSSPGADNYIIDADYPMETYL